MKKNEALTDCCDLVARLEQKDIEKLSRLLLNVNNGNVELSVVCRMSDLYNRGFEAGFSRALLANSNKKKDE